jgi:hypothetical protein
MKFSTLLATASAAFSLTSTARAAESTGNAFYGDAPDEHHPWAVHDRNRPQPKRVEPLPYDAEKAKAPADAVVLFGGSDSDVNKWEADKAEGGPTAWIAKDGVFQCVPKSGYVRTKEKFGDIQLHVEWSAPTPPQGDSQGRGNSGIFLEGLVEIQVLDNYNNPTYADGFACSMYGVSPPLANALRPPGEWQSVDITFRRPIYKDGKCEDPGFVTVYCNGVLMQDRVQIEGGTGHKARPKPGPFPETGPLKLQDHGNPVRYRNIWLRPLPPRTADEHATTVTMTAEATAAKRKEIAASIREDAAKLQGSAKLLRLLESLTYENEAATVEEAEKAANAFLDEAGKLPAGKIETAKGDIIQLNNALQYLVKFNRVPEHFGPKKAVVRFIIDHGWEEKKAVPKKK